MSRTEINNNYSVDTGNLDPYIQESEGILACIGGMAIVLAAYGSEALKELPQKTLTYGRKILNALSN